MNNLRESHPIEQKMGIRCYCSKSDGIGGKIRVYAKDFKVEEILTDGRILKFDDKNFSFGESEPGLFTEFVLIKRNIESHHAQIKIVTQLGASIEDINICGTKDKSAYTAQKATIWRKNPSELLNLQLKGITIRAPRTTIYKTFLGNLKGNYFTIKIREVNSSKEEITKKMEDILHELKNFGGIANFFGHQRFGTRRPISHEIGKLILLGKIEEAILNYLTKISENEHEKTIVARKTLLETNDPKLVIEKFPKDMIFERSVLTHLSKYPNDYKGALQLLPKNLIRIFIHSYQSYIWNLVLSKRLELFDNLLPNPDDFIENNAVVLPIIGMKTDYKDNILIDYMKELLENENIQRENFNLKNIIGLRFPGSNRNIAIKLENLSSDITNTKENEFIVTLKFSLFAGSYATIVLREFMKASPLYY